MKIFVALIHYPVLNKHDEIITSAVTNLDMHDIARASRCYGVQTYYVATPLKDQQRLAADLAGHWLEGIGGEKNPDRRDALGIIKIVDLMESAVKDIETEIGFTPLIYATSAVNRTDSISWNKIRSIASSDEPRPILLLFGTASGLSEKIMERVDGIISPIKGPVEYNHLSVRSAVSITLDRILGRFC